MQEEGRKQGIRLYNFLENRRTGISQADIEQTLGISSATFKRALRYLRGQSITIYPPSLSGYRIDPKDKGRFNLAGELLDCAQLGLLLDSYKQLQRLAKTKLHQAEINPILQRMEHVLGQKHSHHPIDAIYQQVRRDYADNFQKALAAIEQKSTISAIYEARSSGTSKRVISAQRLLRYRENWYLIGFCHQKEALRIFALERLQQIEPGCEPFVSVPENLVSDEYQNTYDPLCIWIKKEVSYSNI